MTILINVIKFLGVVIATFGLAQIITNKNNRISIIGTFLVACSTALVEYIDYGMAEALIFGEVLIICINEISRVSKYKYIAILGVFISIVGYSLLSNLSFQISVGLALIPIIIWIIIKNRKLIEEHYNIKNTNKKEINNSKYVGKSEIINNKNVDKNKISEQINLTKNQIILLILAVALAIVISVVFYKYKTIKSIEKVNGISYLMSYTYSYNIPFNKDIKFVNSSALATCISIFPMVLFVAIFYIFKFEKHSEFLILTSIMSILQVISISSSKMFFENISPNYIIAIGISILQIYMMMYIFANVEEKLFTLKSSAYISLVRNVIFIVCKISRTNFAYKC